MMLEINAFVKAVIAAHSHFVKAAQVFDRALWLNHQRHHGGIRRDDKIIFEAAFEAQNRHAERFVLIGFLRVKRAKSRFRDAPRHASRAAISDLLFARRFGRPSRAANFRSCA